MITGASLLSTPGYIHPPMGLHQGEALHPVTPFPESALGPPSDHL